MRISSAAMYQATIDNLQRRQAALVDAQERLTSGKRVEKPSDDPVAAARAERALAAKARAESAQRVIQTSQLAMQQAETALGDATELLQQARELVLGAGNRSYSDAERRNVADQLRQIRTRLLAIANRDDGAGARLFAGQGAAGLPFVDDPAAAGGVRYDGTPGENRLVAGDLLPLSVDGDAVWLSVRDPQTGLDDLSVFGVLDRIAGELATPGQDGTTINTQVRAGLRDLDASLDHLSSQRARLGEMLGRIDAIGLRLSRTVLDAETERSNAEELDMVQAISDFQNQQTGYDAALKTYSTVQRMSLFDYLR